MTEVDAATGEIVPAPLEHRRAPDSFGVLGQAIRLAEVIASTEMVPKALRGRPDAVVAVVLAGHELGLGPMQSLAQVNLINGRPSLAAEAMRALVMAAGHLIVLEAGDESATVRVHRRDWPAEQWSDFSFTRADAERAGLWGRDTWKSYPRAMLSARATSEACRAVFADVLAGISYTPDELDVIDVSVPPCESIEAPSEPPATMTPPEAVTMIQGADALEHRLLGQSAAVRNDFKSWRHAKGHTWPPANVTVLKEMSGELDKLAKAAALESDTYDEEPPLD